VFSYYHSRASALSDKRLKTRMNSLSDNHTSDLLLASANSNGPKNYGTSNSDDECISVGSEGQESEFSDEIDLPAHQILCILSTAFSYGCIMTTLFLITLPVECERISKISGNPHKSVALGIFVAIAGVTQLVSPLIGRMSDSYQPPMIQGTRAEIGQRMPYLVFGSVLAVAGLCGQMLASYAALWIRYTFCFFGSMVGLNIQYAMLIALIPDQIPRRQTGVANGILAFLLMTGSLFGFALFHTYLAEDIGSMYGLYTCIVIIMTILTGTHAHERDAEIYAERLSRRSHRQPNKVVIESGNVAASPVQKEWHRKARKVARKAAKKVVKKAHEIVVTPTLIVKSLFYPLHKLSWLAIAQSYSIDVKEHYNFFIVTLSRLFYYCGMSVQTFFLYFVHDIIGIRSNPEAAVATLAIIGQCSGGLFTFPVGIISDRFLNGRRTPFVYVACGILGTATLSIIFATTFQHMVIACTILGAANGVYLCMETSLAVDTLPGNSDIDGECGSAQLLGIWVSSL
jgi:hypothetical protein